ncbi:ArnT family glycosyltransferase [Thermodesulfobacteriota bacterium]
MILLIGFAVRFFAYHHTYLLNPDGVLYIHQARAIYYGDLEKITSCNLQFISVYPFLIVGAFTVFRDWIMAASFVSLFFGTLTLLPLYLLLRRFFDKQISTLTTLSIALIPMFVSRSADVVRGPIYWFFLVLGLYFFLVHIDRKTHLHLIFSCLSFLVATWARYEALLFIIVSSLFLLLSKEENKLKTLTVFVSPFIAVVIFFLLGNLIFNFSGDSFHQILVILEKISGPAVQYNQLRTSLDLLMAEQKISLLILFLPEAKNLIWLIALGTVLGRFFEAFFVPFALVFLLGFGGVRKKCKDDPRVFFCVLTVISGMVLLYVHILSSWVMENRFFALVIYPGAIFLGFGLQNIIVFLHSKYQWKKSIVFAIACLAIVVLTMPFNLESRRLDKLIFKDIGELVAQKEKSSAMGEVVVSTSKPIQGWVSFYANLTFPGAPCPQHFENCWERFPDSYGKFISTLKEKKIKYFLWDERFWPKEKFNIQTREYYSDLKELGRWKHADTGQMILFEVI